MEVLQTSALPLGDGAGRNLESYCRRIPAAASSWNNSARPASRWRDATRGRRGEQACCQSDVTATKLGENTQAARTERASKRQRSEGRQLGCRGPQRFKFGAGNGIRTRDFDLGKVALYH